MTDYAAVPPIIDEPRRTRMLAVKRDGIGGEELFPSPADERVLRSDDVQKLVKRVGGDMRIIMCDDASSLSRKPDLGSSG